MEVYQHKKTGNVYKLEGIAKFETSKDVKEGEILAVWKAEHPGNGQPDMKVAPRFDFQQLENYEEIEHALAELQAGLPLKDGDLVAVYRGTTKKLWARPFTEFKDGRFQPVAEGNPLIKSFA